MQIYIFNAEIESHADGQIFTASNGAGYVEDNELHITQEKYHFVYKFDEDEGGWYMRNAATGEDIFLGEGACPSAEYDDMEFADEEYFAAIARLNDESPKLIETTAETTSAEDKDIDTIVSELQAQIEELKARLDEYEEAQNA